MDTCCAPASITLQSSWWQRVVDGVAAAVARWRGPPGAGHAAAERELAALEGLSPATLRDIGAPEWLQDRAARARDLIGRMPPW